MSNSRHRSLRVKPQITEITQITEINTDVLVIKTICANLCNLWLGLLIFAAMNKVIFKDLGRIDYKEAWDYQQQLHDELVDTKRSNRKAIAEGEQVIEQKHYLLFCEHPPVYTLGKSGSEDNLLLDEQKLKKGGFTFYKINRGGDITYHGPGQIVAYPIFDLDYFFTDVHKYVRFLEEAVIRTLAEYDIEAMRVKEYTGVWLKQEGWKPMRKICAIGVHLSRWVTLHGLAFNINTKLEHFGNIIPCGINDVNKGVTSLAAELNQVVDIEEVKLKLKNHFAELFEFEFDMLATKTQRH